MGNVWELHVNQCGVRAQFLRRHNRPGSVNALQIVKKCVPHPRHPDLVAGLVLIAPAITTTPERSFLSRADIGQLARFAWVSQY